MIQDSKIILKMLMTDSARVVFDSLSSEGFESRFVGGCVRDAILGVLATDIDIATTASPDSVKKCADGHGIRAIPTGVNHGTWTLVVDDHHYQVTTLRKDIKTYGRHADVDFNSSWLEDASRRDFTFNAIYLDESGKVYDFFDGISDLNNRIVRFIGDAEKRIDEDHLRILRFFRFWVRFCGTDLDDDTSEIISRKACLVKSLSSERVSEEFLKILSYDNYTKAAFLMSKLGILKELGITLSIDVEFEDITKDVNFIGLFKDIPLFRFATIFECDDAIHRFRLSRKQASYVKKLTPIIQYDLLKENELIKAIILYGKEAVISSIIKNSNVNYKWSLFKFIKNFNVPEFPIAGKDVVSINGDLSGGKIGEAIDYCYSIWVESLGQISKEELLSILIKWDSKTSFKNVN